MVSYYDLTGNSYDDDAAIYDHIRQHPALRVVDDEGAVLASYVADPDELIRISEDGIWMDGASDTRPAHLQLLYQPGVWATFATIDV